MGYVRGHSDQAARRYLESVNLGLIAAAGTRRQRHYGEGERAPASIARPPVDLGVIELREPGRKPEPLTEIGKRTAVRKVPRVLARLAVDDPRLQVAGMIAAAAEQIGAVGGAMGEATASKSVFVDGGISTKIKHAERLRLYEGVANGRVNDVRQVRAARGDDRVVMAVQRKRGNRQEIKAFPLLMAVCAFGCELSDVLRAHGWKDCSQNTGPLGDDLLNMLHDIAAVLGYIAPRKKGSA
jgi:hypothetical protein